MREKQFYFYLFFIVYVSFFLPKSLASQSAFPTNERTCSDALRNAVLAGDSSETEILSLWEAAKTEAVLYTTWEKDAQEAEADFYMGMYYYYISDEVKAGDFFDKGIVACQKSLETEKNAVNTALYAALILHNASVKKINYQLKWVPKIKGIADSAIAMDGGRFYTKAYIVSYETQCFFPSPYGNYKAGIAQMQSLLKDDFPKTSDDFFTIYCSIGYAYKKIGRTKEAIDAYKMALSYFPHNPDVLKSLSALQK